MTAQTTDNNIDFTLLEQYLDILGKEGLGESLRTFHGLMPVYLSELEEEAAQKDEDAFRRQAHKIKGGCRSLGFTRLGQTMQFLERETWDWQEVEPMLTAWREHLQTDYEQVATWIETARG
ncbi:Hpt domain-containing protein [Aliidiomarina sp. Khilg15.8]